MELQQKDLFPDEVRRVLEQYYSARQLSTICGKITTPPRTTVRVNTLLTNTQFVVSALRELIPKIQAYELYEAECGVKVNYNKLVAPHPVLHDVVTIDTLRSTTCVADDAFPRVWIDRICAEAVLRGAHVFAPGVKAAQDSVLSGSRVNVFVDLDGQITKGSVEVHTGGVRKEAAVVFLGIGLAHIGRTELFGASAVRRGVAIEMLRMPFLVAPPLAEILPGLIYPQNLPSVLTTYVLDPQPGELVLDLCASPGGKTTHIAARMRNNGVVVAVDKNERKVCELRATVLRLGVQIVRAFCMDATKYRKYIVDAAAESQFEDGLPLRLARETFDRVLVDTSCSGIGMRPRLRHNALGCAQLAAYPKHQLNILRAAVMLVKVNGVIVYSTCTLNPEENECVVADALRLFPLALEAPSNEALIMGAPGCTQGTGLHENDAKRVQRFDLDGDADSLDCSAFFCARLRKLHSFA